MQWSRLKHRVEECLAPSVRTRIALHQARYRYTREEVGRVWITMDGQEIASFDTASYVAKRADLGAQIRDARGLRPYGDAGGHSEHLEADAEAGSKNGGPAARLGFLVIRGALKSKKCTGHDEREHHVWNLNAREQKKTDAGGDNNSCIKAGTNAKRPASIAPSEPCEKDGRERDRNASGPIVYAEEFE